MSDILENISRGCRALQADGQTDGHSESKSRL